MNNKPEYRAWCKPNSCMGDVADLDFMHDEVWVEGCQADIPFKFDQVVLMMFTGHKDSKGTKIFDGDIIKYPYKYRSNHFECFTLIKYDNGFLMAQNLTKIVDHKALSVTSKKSEVVGNIHQNPELL